MSEFYSRKPLYLLAGCFVVGGSFVVLRHLLRFSASAGSADCDEELEFSDSRKSIFFVFRSNVMEKLAAITQSRLAIEKEFSSKGELVLKSDSSMDLSIRAFDEAVTKLLLEIDCAPTGGLEELRQERKNLLAVVLEEELKMDEVKRRFKSS